MTVSSDEIAARLSAGWAVNLLDKAVPLVLVDLVNTMKEINKTLQSMDSSLGKVEIQLQ